MYIDYTNAPLIENSGTLFDEKSSIYVMICDDNNACLTDKKRKAKEEMDGQC